MEKTLEDHVGINALRLNGLECIPTTKRVRQAEHVVEVQEEDRRPFGRLDAFMALVVIQPLQIGDSVLEPRNLLRCQRRLAV